jgi:hypothetical protein
VVREGEAEQDAFAVPVLVHSSPWHVVVPVAVTVRSIFVVMMAFSASPQDLTLLLLLSMKSPSQKIAPVVASVHSSMHVVLVSLSHLE